MFHFGRAVSSFDIAALVDPMRRERDAQRHRKLLDKGSIIGTLIEEALVEFTSLDRDSENPADNMASKPLNIGSFENVQDWGADLAEMGGVDSEAQRQVLPSERFEVGNLAALEDDSPSARRHRAAAPASDAPASISSLPPSSIPKPAPVPQMEATLPAPASQRVSGRLGMIALLVLFLILAGVAGAYFAGLLPQSLLRR